MTITIHHGDSREVLKTLADASIDSVVCDPPYALVSITKRFGKADAAAPSSDGATGVYKRAAAGFMGQQWDTGETAFAVEFWAEVMRVLKPGGHVVAFSGTRTYHRLACAIEDAGFEMRDMLQWLYGSGFPKSHDVSKGIDRSGVGLALQDEITAHLVRWRNERGLTNRDLNVAIGSMTNGSGMAGHWTRASGHREIPSKAQWLKLRAVLAWTDCHLDGIYEAVKDGAARPTIAVTVGTRLAVAPGQGRDRGSKDIHRTAPATDAARQWDGWGTALKPACEPIVLARKPLSGTVAANVLEHGTGALNIDGCRIATDETITATRNVALGSSGAGVFGAANVPGVYEQRPGGRWPANIAHDGSDEVLAMFPDTSSGSYPPEGGMRSHGSTFGAPNARGEQRFTGSDGSAARFFYTAKADATDRLGSKHPTVKPTDLMRWLCRLVTPPGGLILDPFAGSGSTGVAAIAEGFDAILIEREAEYVSDIRRRIAWAQGEGRLTAQEMAKVADISADDLPLFAQPGEAA